ncbi:MAG: O-antigen ligase family protein, partial [Tepidiformaceae bacterium]
MVIIAAIVALELALLVGMLILREPKLIILAVIIGLPVEYLSEKALGGLGTGGVSGGIRALLNPGKAAMLATIIIAVVRLRHEPKRLIPDSSFLLPLTFLMVFIMLGVFWADSLRPQNAVLIMPMYVAFVFVAPSLIEDRRDVERIIGTFLLVCIGLAVLALAQRTIGIFHWRTILIDSDGYSYRSNATFSDPNHLARYFAVCMSLAVGLILTSGPRRTTVYLAIPALVLGLAAIMATGSRSGWAMLLLVTGLVVLCSPIARYTKAKLVLVSGGGFVAMLALLLMQGGGNAERVRSLANPITALGQREFLINAGWHMFLDNPLIGVGSGNYQHALLISYRHLIPIWAEVTLSHTSIITILAETGIVGLLAFLFVSVRFGIGVMRTYYATKQPYNRLIVGWLGVSLLGIVFHSQSEGRLFDEPYIYLLLAILVAIETGSAFADRRATTVTSIAAEALPAGEPSPIGPSTVPKPQPPRH